MLDWICKLNCLIGLLFVLFYSYQGVYLLAALLQRPKKPQPRAPRRYAVLIAARNEENVIAQLLESIRAQDYPQELLDVFVVADNCTDCTAQIARQAGAKVYERFNTSQVGKGYALDWLTRQLSQEHRDEDYAGYFIFDADNLLARDYVRQMNDCFDPEQFAAVTSYRNSKNFGDTWISSGYALWFLREARYLNGARMLLGTSCAVSGTGYLVSSRVLRLSQGWPYHLLCEDVQFTAYQIAQGKRIGYCADAVFYDEQPTDFRLSCVQRLRWARGNLQIFKPYGRALCKGVVQRCSLSCLDALFVMLPALLLTAVSLVSGALGLLICLLTRQGALQLLGTMLPGLAAGYGILLLVGGITLFTERRRIHASTWQRVRALFTFPIFMGSYAPIGLCSLFVKIRWKPIPHKRVMNLKDVEKVGEAV